MHGRVKEKVWRNAPRPHTDWLSRGLAIMAIVICGGELALYLTERQAFLREDVYVQLMPSFRDTNVQILYDDNTNTLVLGFAFEGRIINQSRSPTTISRWEIVGANETWQASTPTSFLGCSGLSCILTEPTGERSPPAELKFPSVVAPGACLDFDVLLHVGVAEELLGAELDELIGDARSSTVSRRALETALEDVGDLCGNPAPNSLPEGEDNTRWLRVSVRLYTNRRHSFGYDFLWAPPYRISEGRELRTVGS